MKFQGIVTLKDLKIRSAPPESGIRINTIQADLVHVVKSDSRVDIAQGNKRAFVVEHILSPLMLLGIEDAEVLGSKGPWDFARPVHRFAYSVGMDSSSVFGPADGRHHLDLAKTVWDKKDIVFNTSNRFKTVPKKVTYEDPYCGSIEITPGAKGTGLSMELISGDNRIMATVYVNGRENPRDMIVKVLSSRTPAVCGLKTEEALWHAVGDFTADLAGIGGLTDGKIVAHLGMNYHVLTIGALQKAFMKGDLT